MFNKPIIDKFFKYFLNQKNHTLTTWLLSGKFGFNYNVITLKATLPTLPNNQSTSFKIKFCLMHYLLNKKLAKE